MYKKIYYNEKYKYNSNYIEQGYFIFRLKDLACLRMGNVKIGAGKHTFDKCIYFSEMAGREALSGYAPDMEEFSHVRFSDKDICSVIMKIKINDDNTTPNTARVLAINSHFWWLGETWQVVSPNKVGIRLKTYTAKELRNIKRDSNGNITIVQTTDICKLLKHSTNYDAETSRAISLNIRLDRIKTDDTKGDIFTEEIEPNEENNIKFSLHYIGVYKGDYSCLI